MVAVQTSKFNTKTPNMKALPEEHSEKIMQQVVVEYVVIYPLKHETKLTRLETNLIKDWTQYSPNDKAIFIEHRNIFILMIKKECFSMSNSLGSKIQMVFDLLEQ